MDAPWRLCAERPNAPNTSAEINAMTPSGISTIVKMPPDSTLPTIPNIRKKNARTYNHIVLRLPS